MGIETLNAMVRTFNQRLCLLGPRKMNKYFCVFYWFRAYHPFHINPLLFFSHSLLDNLNTQTRLVVALRSGWQEHPWEITTSCQPRHKHWEVQAAFIERELRNGQLWDKKWRFINKMRWKQCSIKPFGCIKWSVQSHC